MVPSKMTSDQFSAWRRRMRLKQKQAAEIIGVHKNSIVNYENGVRPGDGRKVEIPLPVAWACVAIEANLQNQWE